LRDPLSLLRGYDRRRPTLGRGAAAQGEGEEGRRIAGVDGGGARVAEERDAEEIRQGAGQPERSRADSRGEVPRGDGAGRQVRDSARQSDGSRLTPRDFDPDAAAGGGSGIFGLPCTAEESRVVVVPVPFEATTSYGGGTSRGPSAVFNASKQV